MNRFRKPGPATSTRSRSVAQPLGQRLAQLLGDLARLLAQRPRQHHGRVGGVVAELGLGRALQRRRRHGALDQAGGGLVDLGGEVG